MKYLFLLLLALPVYAQEDPIITEIPYVEPNIEPQYCLMPINQTQNKQLIRENRKIHLKVLSIMNSMK